MHVLWWIYKNTKQLRSKAGSLCDTQNKKILINGSLHSVVYYMWTICVHSIQMLGLCGVFMGMVALKTTVLTPPELTHLSMRNVCIDLIVY